MKFLLELSPLCSYAMIVWLYGQPGSKNFTVHLFGRGRKCTFESMDEIPCIFEEVMHHEGYEEVMEIVVETSNGDPESTKFAGCCWDRYADSVAWHALTAENTKSLMKKRPGKYVDWLKAYPSSPVLYASWDEFQRMAQQFKKKSAKKKKTSKVGKTRR